jgi:hypothetical protein
LSGVAGAEAAAASRPAAGSAEIPPPVPSRRALRRPQDRLAVAAFAPALGDELWRERADSDNRAAACAGPTCAAAEDEEPLRPAAEVDLPRLPRSCWKKLAMEVAVVLLLTTASYPLASLVQPFLSEEL